MSISLGTAIGYLSLDITDFNKKLNTALGEATTMSSKFSSTLGSGLDTVGKSVTNVGKKITTCVTAPVAGIGIAAIKTGANFDSAMSKVKATSGATGTEFDALRQKAIQMGNDTKFTAEESADALYYMALAGWEPTEMLDGLQGVMDLAAASGANLATTSDIVTDALTGFHMEASESTHFANILAAAMSNSNTTVEGLGEAFKYVAPIAGSFGYTAEDTAIALGLMADAGVKGSTAGTSLRQAIVQLTKPTDKSAALMEQYGISLYDGEGKAYSLMEVMNNLRDTFGGLDVEVTNADGSLKSGEQILEEYGDKLPITQQEKLTAVTQIFGTRAMPGILSIIDRSKEDFDDLSSAIYGADEAFDGAGAATGMAQMMMDNLKGDVDLLKSAFGTMSITISDMVSGSLRGFVQKITDLITKFNEMSPEQQRQIVKFAAMAAAVGPVLMGVGKLISIAGKLITGFKTMSTAIQQVKIGFMLIKAAIAGCSAPVLGIVAAIGVLIGVFVTLWNNNEEFRNKMIEIWNGIVEKVKGFVQGIKDRMGGIKEAFDNIISVVKPIWEAFCNDIAPLFTGAFQIISNILGGILDAIMAVVDIFIGIFTGDWEKVWTGIKDLVGATLGTVLKNIGVILESIWGVISNVLGRIKGFWDMIWGGISSFFRGIWNGIKSIVSNVLNGVKNVINTQMKLTKVIITTVWNAIKGVITTVMNNIKLVITTVWNAIKLVISTVLNVIKTVISTVWNAIKTVITTVVNAIKAVVIAVWNTIKTNVTTVVNAIKTVITTVWNVIKTVVSTVVNGIKTAVTTAWNTIKTNVSTVVNAIKTVVSTVWNAIKTTVSTVVDGIKDAVTTAWNTMQTSIDTVMGAIKTVVSTAWDAIKGVINSIIGGIEGMANGVISGINTVIKALNKLKFDIPDWVPGLGGKTFGFNIPELNKVSIPRLAKGGIVDQATLAVVGEQGREAIVPLENNLRWITELAENVANCYRKIVLPVLTKDILGILSSGSIIVQSNNEFDYSRFATVLTSILIPALKYVKIINEVNMEDGDVYMDAERVGRKLAPIISRIIAH